MTSSDLQSNQITHILLLGPFTAGKTKTLIAQDHIGRDFALKHYIWLNSMVLPILHFLTLKMVFSYDFI